MDDEIVRPAWQARYRSHLSDTLAARLEMIPRLPLAQAHEHYKEVLRAGEVAALRYLCAIDRYFLLLHGLHRSDLLGHGPKGNSWLYTRCREVEADPDGYLDLWAREHYKSTIISLAGTIQEILRDPEITVSIFSFNRPTAKAFLRQIMQELETNPKLHAWFPDILWERPSQAPRWGEESGIVVKRKGNPKEATVEAWGLVDGQPTGRHFRLRIYDDVVTRESVTTEEQIKKVTEARELSDNTGTRGGREWNIGTRYHFGDTYGIYLDRKVLKARIHPATHDGTLDGTPVFLTPGEWAEKKRKQPTQVAAQMLLNPVAGKEKMFQAAWYRGFEVRPRTLNVYILVDPSKGSPSRRSDRTAMAVIGVDAAWNKYLLDGFRHRMNLQERWKALKGLYQRWKREPGVQLVRVGYERYGLQSDIEHFEEMMRLEKNHFPIDEVAWTRDHSESKADRVERLVPDIKGGKFHLPAVVLHDGEVCSWARHESEERIVFTPLQGDPKSWERMKATHQDKRIQKHVARVDEDRQVYDLTCCFLEESIFFPFSTHDDLIDACSRIYDMAPTPPMLAGARDLAPPVHVDT